MKHLILLAALVAACSHKETQQSTTPPPANAADPKPMEAGPKPITSDDDYIARGTELTNRLIEIFNADGTDCDKLADDLDKLHTDAGVMDAYDKDHPDAKAKLQLAMEKRQGDVMTAIAPAMNACQKNEKFMAVLSKK